MGAQRHWLVVAQWDPVAVDFVPIASLPDTEKSMAETMAEILALYPERPQGPRCVVVKRTGAQLARWMMSVHLDLHESNRRSGAGDDFHLAASEIKETDEVSK